MSARETCLDILKRLGIDDVGRYDPKHVIVNAYQLNLLIGSLLAHYPSDQLRSLAGWVQKKAPRANDRCGDDPVLSLLMNKPAEYKEVELLVHLDDVAPEFKQEYMCHPPGPPPCDFYQPKDFTANAPCVNCGHEKKWHEGTG